MSVRVSTSKQWGVLEVDIRVRLPDGTRHREWVKSPVQSRSGAKRWGEERERYLALHGRAQPKKEVPTLEEFSRRRHEMRRTAEDGGIGLGSKSASQAAALATHLQSSVERRHPELAGRAATRGSGLVTWADGGRIFAVERRGTSVVLLEQVPAQALDRAREAVWRARSMAPSR